MKIETHPADAYNFLPGMCIAFVRGRPRWIRDTRGNLTVFGAFYLAWRRVSRPFRRKTVVSAVDVVAGKITLEQAPRRWWQFLD